MMIENHYYLFVHFRETTTPDGEQVYFALSKDGFHWEALNAGKPVLWAYYGDHGERDMAVFRDPKTGMSHYIMLQRNLIYTGITRAKKILLLVGTKKALAYAVRNVTVTQRNTMLKERLQKALGTYNT